MARHTAVPSSISLPKMLESTPSLASASQQATGLSVSTPFCLFDFLIFAWADLFGFGTLYKTIGKVGVLELVEIKQ